MRKILLVVAGLLCAISVNAQTRTDLANYALFQQYYNPALTGNHGAALKSFYRNQWTGFEDAPQTMFVSGEFTLSGLGNRNSRNGRRMSTNDLAGGNALGLLVLHDTFGPYAETKINLSYGAAVRLTEKLHLRWGTALTYQANRLDGTKLTIDQSDPKYQHLLGQNNRKSKFDVNIGIGLAASNYYLGYALQDATKDGFYKTGDDFMEESYARKHVVQAGYRTLLTNQLGIIVNGIFVQDALQKETIEAQLKGVYQNTFWAGAGYRKDLAYTLLAGLKLKQLQLGYAYEMPAGDAAGLPNSTNEIVLSYHFGKSNNPTKGSKLTIW